ncbi:MAG: hypothetical protein J5855_10355 [Mailhella sp.]|nr:hypothetical protein [Mailhella sp.]
MAYVKTFSSIVLAGTLTACLSAVFSDPCRAAPSDDPSFIKRQIGYAEYYVREFEEEVARQRGGEKMVWRSKKDALDRVQQLKIDYPDDPEVEKLYQRVRSALMKSKGDYTETAAEWTTYLHNEENLRKVIAEAAEKEWKAVLEKHGGKVLAKAFPSPDSADVTVDDLKGTLVLLEDVQYPHHQFYGATGEYVYCGKPSSGYYFVNIGGRDWLGPYEAVKRYRRSVDTSLLEVKSWTVLGEIVNITAEIPQAGEEKTGNFQFGWVVKPVALYVPGHVMAVHDAGHDSSGRYIGEEKVEEIKNGWYTVKEVPDDVTPERLMEIFMTAIKEKNYPLYVDCIDPERRKSDVGDDLLRYHWDLHQERFHGEYVHAAFGEAKISVVKGFDESNEQENFFLDDKQKETLVKIGGTKVEEAIVESRAYDPNGKQLGTPHPHKLIRRGGGRWYVEDYAPRF